MYVKEYDSWNIVKQNIEKQIISPYFKQKQVWWVKIGTNVGDEIDGKGNHFSRPVLILKKLNHRLFLGLPLSTKLKRNPYYVRITIKGKVVCAVISQIRIFSSKRLNNYLTEISVEEYSRINEICLKKLSPTTS